MERQIIFWVGTLCILASIGCKTGPAISGTEVNASAAAMESSSTAPQIVDLATSEQEPIAAQLTLVPSTSIDAAELYVQVQVEPGYYLHAEDPEHPETVPLRLSLDLPPGVTQLAAVKYPEPQLENGQRTYRNQVLLSVALAVAAESEPDLLEKVSASWVTKPVQRLPVELLKPSNCGFKRAVCWLSARDAPGFLIFRNLMLLL